ncbi:MAG TPA: RNA pseudouridine synthase [Allosphingosinicella sp.]|jgi:tRNA pseudouridine32 synthase/23S rRNA pseudouridine746 synthase
MWDNRILFEDSEALVIDKPAGLAVHPGPKTRESLEHYLGQMRFGFQRPPSIVHRLDRDTSGCLLLARHPKAHKRFALAFEEGRVSKTYLAVLDSVPEAESGTIDIPLHKISSREEGWRMVPDAERGKRAVTHWQLVAQQDGRAMLLMTPETGRTHQLRVHAKEGLGIAIAGDPVYGAGRGPMLLHARALRLEREGKEPIEALAPVPPTFVQVGFEDGDY